MKKIFFLLLTVLFIFNFSVFFNPINAQGQSLNQTNPATAKNSLDNPLGKGMDSPQKLIGRVIDSILGIVGSLALLMFVFGGLTWMTSSGNAEKIQKGKNIIVWAAIGLVIVFFAYGLTRVLIVGIKGT